MGWRTVVVSKPSKIDLRLGYAVIRDVDSTVRVHISEISVLIIETTAVSITTALLAELVKQKVKVIFCDEKQNPVSELLPYYGSHDCSQKLKIQTGWSDFTKQSVWTHIIAQKITKQAENLMYFGLAESQKLFGYLEELELFDKTNREGHAAKVYFNAMFGKNFSRSDECPVNAALNYGYSILLSCINREIAACGYSTMLGLFHDNIFNQFNLSCDLMEPFRPVIDRYVKEAGLQKFESEEKHKLLSLLNLELMIDGRRQTLLNTIKIYTKSVLDALVGDDISMIKYYKYEL